MPSDHRVTFSVSAEMREKINRIAALMGLSEAGAARYLVSRGLEGLLGLLSTSQTADTLKSMFEVMEREVTMQEKMVSKQAKKADRVLVTPDLRQKKLSVGEKKGRKNAVKKGGSSGGASLFDIQQDKKK